MYPERERERERWLKLHEENTHWAKLKSSPYSTVNRVQQMKVKTIFSSTHIFISAVLRYDLHTIHSSHTIML